MTNIQGQTGAKSGVGPLGVPNLHQTNEELARTAYESVKVADDPFWDRMTDYLKERYKKISRAVLSPFQNSLYRVDEAGVEIYLESREVEALITHLDQYLPEGYRRNNPDSSLRHLIYKALWETDSKRQEVIAEFRRFQKDVGVYLRAIAVVAVTVGNGESDEDTRVRMRGLVAQIESAIARVEAGYDFLLFNSFSDRPDLFRSDYPVHKYVQKSRKLEARVKELEEQLRQATTFSRATGES
jgi:RNA polymerase-binding transcription factor DksA